MAQFEQGDLLKIDGIQQPVIVVSNNVFNQSGKAIVWKFFCQIGQELVEKLFKKEMVVTRDRIGRNRAVWLIAGRRAIGNRHHKNSAA